MRRFTGSGVCLLLQKSVLSFRVDHKAPCVLTRRTGHPRQNLILCLSLLSFLLFQFSSFEFLREMSHTVDQLHLGPLPPRRRCSPSYSRELGVGTLPVRPYLVSRPDSVTVITFAQHLPNVLLVTLHVSPLPRPTVSEKKFCLALSKKKTVLWPDAGKRASAFPRGCRERNSKGKEILTRLNGCGGHSWYVLATCRDLEP